MASFYEYSLFLEPFLRRISEIGFLNPISLILKKKSAKKKVAKKVAKTTLKRVVFATFFLQF